MRDRRFRLAIDCAVLLACVLAACDGDDDTDPPGSRPNAPIDLWDLPGGLVGSRGGTNGGAGGVQAFDAGPITQPGARDAAMALWDDDGSIPPDMQPDPSLDRFDPDQVYIFGTLSEGACDRDAVAKVTAPNHALVGFDCEANTISAQIRPSDGAMLYQETFDTPIPEVLVFHCDGCTYQRLDDRSYPDDPKENDGVITHPACTSNSYGSAFRVAQDGTIYYSCAGTEWYDPSGTIVATGRLLAVNSMRVALMDTGLVDLATSSTIDFDGLPAGALFTAVRARGNEFWAVVRGSDPSVPPELWRIQDDGTATIEGVYPQTPPGQSPAGYAALDAKGRLVQIAEGAGLFDTIIRRSVQGESKVIYDERDNPVVKLHISGLFTGP